ncbi:hypothetical protein CANARDRAFT_178756, partial [[Candida] arabinofermentans NRRL YB-2248]
MFHQIPVSNGTSTIEPNGDKYSSSMRTAKSRLPSLSSLLGSSENTLGTINKEEKVSFRKMAKSLLFNTTEKCSDYKTPVLESTVSNFERRTYTEQKSYPNSLQYEKQRDERRYGGSQIDKKLKQLDFAEKEDSLLTQLMEANLKATAPNTIITTGQTRYNGNSKMQGDNWDSGSKKDESKADGRKSRGGERSLKQNENILNTSSNVDTILKGATFRTRTSDEMKPSRVVILSNIKPSTSLTSIMGQLNSGPLEKIRLLNKYDFTEIDNYDLGSTIDWANTVLQLFYYKEEDASQFMKYAATGMFIVNGHHLESSWMPCDQSTDKNRSRLGSKNYSLVADDINDEDDDNSEDSYALKLMGPMENARRVLVFKKPVSAKAKATQNAHNSKLFGSSEKRRPSYPDPILNYSENFDLDDIKKDFSQFGPIVEVSPVVSRKLCFAVQYLDVRSAIIAKHQLMSKESTNNPIDPNVGLAYYQQSPELNCKYKNWYSWYGKDPADKGAILI